MVVHVLTYDSSTSLIREWASCGVSAYICVATVNNVMEAYDSRDFLGVMNGADLVTSDGVPLVWALRLLGHRSATRVYGPDLMPAALAMAQRESLPVGFYGGSPAVLEMLRKSVEARFPRLRIVYSFAPPFRPLTPDEDDAVVEDIRRSGARILFVGLSTPKQDYWMAGHRGRIPAVMLGVGAAFDFLAGTKKQAPRWMMRIGMEWFFRLATEPRRLWRRYLKHNPRFVVLFAGQLVRERLLSRRPRAGAI
jgi:N-acetylglucosaminyldiphosphoundecaprenol N-acetyl-beta-D-mannosaminyltransferase